MLFSSMHYCLVTSLLVDSAIVLVAGHVEVSANFSVSTYLAANECFNGTKLGLIGFSFLHAYMMSIQYERVDAKSGGIITCAEIKMWLYEYLREGISTVDDETGGCKQGTIYDSHQYLKA